MHGIFLVGLGVDSTVIADGVDLLAFPSNLGDSVTLGLLELLNELVHDIDEDNLQDERLANTLCQHLGRAQATSNPDWNSFSATKPRPMFPPPK